MADEILEHQLPRQELADYLEDLARQVRQGTLQVAGTRRELPDNLETKIELKEKKGRIIAKVRFRWLVVTAYDEETQAEMATRQEVFKALKNQLAGTFSDMLHAIELGRLPAESIVLKFMGLSKEFAELADADWESEMQEYLDHVENLALTFNNQQPEMFQHELRDLKVRIKACHQEFG